MPFYFLGIHQSDDTGNHTSVICFPQIYPAKQFIFLSKLHSFSDDWHKTEMKRE